MQRGASFICKTQNAHNSTRLTSSRLSKVVKLSVQMAASFICKRVHKPVSKQASERARYNQAKEASKEATRNASKRASKHTWKRESKQASKQTKDDDDDDKVDHGESDNMGRPRKSVWDVSHCVGVTYIATGAQLETSSTSDLSPSSLTWAQIDTARNACAPPLKF